MTEDEESSDRKQRSALEIAERSLALIAIVSRSQREPWVADWVDRFGIAGYFSGAEKEFLGAEVPEPQLVANFSWRAEALVSLVWCLGGLPEMPPLSEQFWVLDGDLVGRAIKNPNAFRLSVTKRPDDEISEMEGFLYHQHWRVRDRDLGLNRGRAIPLKPGELPTDQLDSSVVYERRYGLSWAVGWGGDWDGVPTDT